MRLTYTLLCFLFGTSMKMPNIMFHPTPPLLGHAMCFICALWWNCQIFMFAATDHPTPPLFIAQMAPPLTTANNNQPDLGFLGERTRGARAWVRHGHWSVDSGWTGWVFHMNMTFWSPVQRTLHFLTKIPNGPNGSHIRNGIQKQCSIGNFERNKRISQHHTKENWSLTTQPLISQSDSSNLQAKPSDNPSGGNGEVLRDSWRESV